MDASSVGGTNSQKSGMEKFPGRGWLSMSEKTGGGETEEKRLSSANIKYEKVRINKDRPSEKCNGNSCTRTVSSTIQSILAVIVSRNCRCSETLFSLIICLPCARRSCVKLDERLFSLNTSQSV